MNSDAIVKFLDMNRVNKLAIYLFVILTIIEVFFYQI